MGQLEFRPLIMSRRQQIRNKIIFKLNIFYMGFQAVYETDTNPSSICGLVNSRLFMKMYKDFTNKLQTERQETSWYSLLKCRFEVIVWPWTCSVRIVTGSNSISDSFS